eukprot:TRINITY_DN8370_c0_g1_i1.p2 TRINITY_DN8370_c0_g1~~TRINITY_DN8370_c0_g1_i1.p2  ORF type:complete len:110 (-),score=21.44 TRINITY_DN8370_c0_g1_i1:521-850(-)
MGHGLNWELALDENAAGLDGRVDIWDLEQLFGDHWRLRGYAKKRVSNMDSERAALYRAFRVECVRRGSAVEEAGVILFLKQRYNSCSRRTKAVFAQMKTEYPTPTTRRS